MLKSSARTRGGSAVVDDLLAVRDLVVGAIPSNWPSWTTSGLSLLPASIDQVAGLLSRDVDQPLRSRFKAAADGFVSNAVNRNLRRAQLSFLGAWTAEWAFTVALGIVAYRDGGATAVGLVGLLRMAPSALLAPLMSTAGNGHEPLSHLTLVHACRTTGAGARGQCPA